MNIEQLQEFREEALAALEENETYIEAQKTRIAELEYHLQQCREVAYKLVAATAGVLPMEYESDSKPKRNTKSKTKATQP